MVLLGALGAADSVMNFREQDWLTTNKADFR